MILTISMCRGKEGGGDSLYALPHSHDQPPQRLHQQAESRWTSGQLVSLTWSQNHTTASSDWACGIQCPPARQTEDKKRR